MTKLVTVTDVRFLKRIKTGEFAFEELSVSANLNEGADSSAAATEVQNFVKGQLGQAPAATVRTKTAPEKKTTPAKKAPAAKAKTAAAKTVKEAATATKAEANKALQSLAKALKSPDKAREVIEEVVGSPKLSEATPEQFAEIVALAAKRLADGTK